MRNIYVFPLIISFLQLAFPTLAETVINYSTSQAEGRTGDIPKVTVWQGSGLSINFISTGEHIVKAWLDDPSKLTVDFDVPICSSPCDSATVIHLKRIKPLNFANLPLSANTLLTVVTEGSKSKKVYYFKVYYGQNEQSRYVAVNVNSDITPLLQERQKVESTIKEKVEKIEKGLKIAKAKSTNKTNLVVFERVTNLLFHVRLGMSFDAALKMENLSPSVLDKLEAIATNSEEGELK